MNKEKIIMNILRILMSFIFLWAFFDKLFGLGFATKTKEAWINGGSPTHGFLSFATKGPFVEFFHYIASLPITDWIFMGSLLFIGLTLLFNKYIRFGVTIGIILLSFMYLSLLQPANNPVIDEHIIYIFVLILISLKTNNFKKNELHI